jgi:hypothetical protein
MKKYITVFILQISCFAVFGQIKGTIKAGSTPNSVIVAIKPAATLTGTKMSSFQFAIGIPSAIIPQPTATILSTDPLISYPAPLVSTETQDGVSYTVYTFSGDGAQSGAGIDYLANQEYNYGQVTFTTGGAIISVDDTRLMQLPNGGSNSNVNFYVADRGIDVTDQTAQFYSALAPNLSNDGSGYLGSSWAKFGGLVLPVKFVNFTAVKNQNTAVINWSVENENSNTDLYKLEVSANGVDFDKVLYSTAPLNNGRTANNYSYLQENISSLTNSGILYFRIKQIDRDGNFVYSVVRSIRLNTKGIAANVYPNPVKNVTSVTFDLESNAKVTLTVTDASGKQLITSQIQGFKGNNISKIDMAKFASGTYTLKVQAGEEVKVISIIKADQ